MLYYATLPLSLLILSLLPVIILSKDCDGSYRGPESVANAINNNQDGFVIFSNGVKFKTAGPLRNGAPPTNLSEAQPGHAHLDWLYYNGTHLVSRQSGHFASQQVDEKEWKFGKLISQELLFKPVNLITAYGNKLLMQLYNKQILVRENHIEFTAELPNNKSLHPTELTRTKDNDIIAFFGPLVGLYEHSNPILPIVLQKTKKYWLSQAWLGCEPDLCFDGSIDAASNHGQYLELYKGKHIVKVTMATKAVSITTPDKGYFVDAAIRDEDDLYLFINKKAYTVEKDGSISEAIFLSQKGNTEAGFSVNRKFYLICQQEVTVFEYSLDLFPIEAFWPDLPERTIDGATAFNGSVYLFFGDYYYRTSSQLNVTNPIYGPFLTQFDLLDCKNDYYKNSVAVRALDIFNKDAFLSYISQFKPKRKPSTTTPSPGTTPSTKGVTGSTTGSTRSAEPSSSTQRIKTQSTRVFVFLVAMVLFLLIVLIALVAFMWRLQLPNKGISLDTLDKTTVATIDSTG
ncbi:hypothetical protein HDE_13107 [Halotydeus destructor]|nr:hypothetical protein HDE_13107 [Halotydeus destructor]